MKIISEEKFTRGNFSFFFELSAKDADLTIEFLQKINSSPLLKTDVKNTVVKAVLDTRELFPCEISLQQMQVLVSLFKKYGVKHHITVFYAPNWSDAYHWEVGDFPNTIKEVFGK